MSLPLALASPHVVALLRNGNLPAAIEEVDRLSAAFPGDPETRQFCALVHWTGGRAREAYEGARAARELDPARAAAVAPVEAEAAAALGLNAEAEAAFRRWIDAAPAEEAPRLRLAEILMNAGRYAEAEIVLAAARPSPKIARRRSICALYFGGIEAADRHVRSALTDPQEGPQARHWLGTVLLTEGRLAEAREAYAQARAADPAIEEAWTDDLFAANYDPGLDAPALKALYADWAARFAPPETPLAAPAPARGARLKIAYVSPDFRRHSLFNFIAPVLAAHDRARVEVHGVSLAKMPDDATEKLRGMCDVWHDASRDGDEALVARARAAGIDVAVDLAGHTAGGRLKAFARRLAPVQVTWLGYGGTTGLTAMDWYLTDAAMTPPGAETGLVERVWRLSRASFAFAPPPGMPDVAPPPMATLGHATFGSFSRLVRINDGVLAAWARILLETPGARLVLNALPLRDAVARGRVEARFDRLGIGRERLELVCTQPQPLTWAAYGGIDVALDPFPHNGGVTTFEALWMGVPVVSLRARPPLGRYGDCLLGALGMKDWCVDDADAYVARAVASVADPAALAATRAGLRPRMANSELCDGAGLARALEDAYAGMLSAGSSSGSA